MKSFFKGFEIQPGDERKKMKRIMANPESVSREIEILYELGLEPSEVHYLTHLREKEDISRKWN
jgi:hypothetical protein